MTETLVNLAESLEPDVKKAAITVLVNVAALSSTFNKQLIDSDCIGICTKIILSPAEKGLRSIASKAILSLVSTSTIICL